MSKTKKPSPAQRRVLENLAAGLSADAHCNTRSDYGGLTGTLAVLRNAGWMSAHRIITDAGRAAIGQAPALEAPAAPTTPVQIQALHRARSALRAIGKTYDDRELRVRALEADEEIDHLLAAAPQAPAAPAEAQRLAEFLKRMRTRLGSCRDACGDEASVQAWDDYERAWTALLSQAAPAAPSGVVGDMAALVKQLAQALRKAAPNHALPAKALDYLRRQDLLGSPLRAAPAAPAVDADPLGLRDVGEALMESIERNAEALKAAGWTAPMDCPSEIVVDLLNLLDEAKAASALGEWVATLEVDSGGGIDVEVLPPCTLPKGVHRLYVAAAQAVNVAISDAQIVAAWKALRPSHQLRDITAGEAAEVKAALLAAQAAAKGA